MPMATLASAYSGTGTTTIQQQSQDSQAGPSTSQPASAPTPGANIRLNSILCVSCVYPGFCSGWSNVRADGLGALCTADYDCSLSSLLKVYKLD